MEHNEVEESHPVGGELVGYFASVAEYLDSGLPSTNPDSGQGGTWTRGSNRSATLSLTTWICYAMDRDLFSGWSYLPFEQLETESRTAVA